MQITIDSGSGCCNGVVRALKKAEEILDREGTLYSLGDIVHNGTEIKRLATKGLKTIDKDAFGNMHDTTVLIRAHGEPPATYATAKENNIRIIDCTCPVVLKLQQHIAQTYRRIREKDGQILIFGKPGHAEVLGLVGQVDGNALVFEKESGFREALENGSIHTDRPIALFSQTTKDLEEYSRICALLRNSIAERGGSLDDFSVTDSICRQVSSRNSNLAEFAEKMDIIIFVCGRESSNGHVLYELCKAHNSRTYMIEDSSEMCASWFNPEDKVGICGATSTPKWQLEKTAEAIRAINKDIR